MLVLRTVLPSLDASLHGAVLDLNPTLFTLLQSADDSTNDSLPVSSVSTESQRSGCCCAAVLRGQAAQTVAAVCRAVKLRALEAVIRSVLPLMSDAKNVHARLGATATLSGTVRCSSSNQQFNSFFFCGVVCC
jgi:hypothetical protein